LTYPSIKSKLKKTIGENQVRLKVSLVFLCALSLSGRVMASNEGWEDDYWSDDNNHGPGRDNRHTPQPTPIDITNATGVLSPDGSTYTVNYTGDSPVSYARLCDGIAKVKMTDGDLATISEKFYLKGKILRKNRDFDLAVGYKVGDSPGFRFIIDSQVVDMCCLRYKGAGTPDPAHNPGQRPGKKPHEVCNPDINPYGCGNTCQASAEDPSQCAERNQQWPGKGRYWPRSS
jgi:hypothetical protein